jgi:hypothetical protein
MYICCDISSAELWPVLLSCVVKKCWYHLPEDGKTMLPKHAGAVWKIEHTNYRRVLLLVLHSYLLHHSALNKQYKIIWYSCVYLIWIILTPNYVLKESKDSQTVCTNTVYVCCEHFSVKIHAVFVVSMESVFSVDGTQFLVKVKFTLYRPWRAQSGSRGIALLILNLGARRGWVVSTTPQPLYPRERSGTHRTRGWVGPRAGLEVAKNIAPAGMRSPDCPARSQSIYRLSYSAHQFLVHLWQKFGKILLALLFPSICLFVTT